MVPFYDYTLSNRIYTNLSIGSGDPLTISTEAKNAQIDYVLLTDRNPYYNLDSDVYLNDGSKKMVCRFLKHFAEILPHPFMRVHKTHIINLQFIKSYHKGTGGYVKLLDNSEIEISPNYKDLFLQHFK